MCKCVFKFLRGEEWKAVPEEAVKAATPGIVTQNVTVTSNVAAARACKLSIVVTPPTGGKASDVVLVTTTATVNKSAVIPVQFQIADSMLAAEYGVELTIDTTV
jgi:hypothetical protein